MVTRQRIEANLGAHATHAENIADFLAQKRIAVSGVSLSRESPANLIYRKLKAAGYGVFPINPKSPIFDGDVCYPSVGSVPGGVDGVVIVNRPEVTAAIVRECAQFGIRRIWMHQSLSRAGTSVSPEAVDFCHQHGIRVIPGACPMMYCEPVDMGHRCIRWFLGITGGLPR